MPYKLIRHQLLLNLSQSCAPVQAYAGKVRADLDHNALKPAVWRVDNYLDGEDEADLGISALVGQRLVFAKNPAVKDEMARTEQVDDYLVGPGVLQEPGHTFSFSPSCSVESWSRGPAPLVCQALYRQI